MNPFLVSTSPLGTVGVVFTPLYDDVTAIDPPIDTVTVTDVPPNSSGARAGLRRGDLLLTLNHQRIRGLAISEFAELIRREKRKGDLEWTGQRGFTGVSFTAIYNGRTDRNSRLVESARTDPAMASATANPAPPHDSIERMAAFEVTATTSTTIDVAFVMARKSLFAELDDPILEAKVIDVRSDAGLRASLRPGDRLLSLNGTPIASMSLRQLGALAARQRRQGLVWEVRRGFETITRRYDGAWIRPLPVPEVVKQP